MMWRTLAPVLLALGATAASAQTVVPQSGEHEGFSRLVMRLPTGTNWSLDQSGTTARLSVDQPGLIFDTSRIFDLIPRTRLRSASQTGPGQPLQLQLGCDCDLSTFIENDGFLVVDIQDPPDNSQQASRALPDLQTGQPVGVGANVPVTTGGYRFNLPVAAAPDARSALSLPRLMADQRALTPTISTPEPVATSQNAPQVDIATEPEAVPTPQLADVAEAADAATADMLDGIRLPLSPNMPGLDLTLLSEEEPVTDPVSNPAEIAEAPVADPEVELPRGPTTAVEIGSDLLLDLEENERAATVNASQDRLLQQIGRATNQGLLDLTGVELRDQGRLLDPLGLADRPLDPLDQIAVTSSVDRESGLFARQMGLKSESNHCMPGYQVAVHNWGTDQPFAEQIPPLRAELVREFDDVDLSSVLRLARAYLYFGFGAEAQAILNMLPRGAVEQDEGEILAAMGAILDGQTMDINHVFAGQQVCDSDVAFWAALADGSIRKQAKTDAIQQAFAKLPPHLRLQVGPRLTTLFAKAGDPHLASAALRSVDRIGAENVPDLNLAEAEVARLEGNVEVVAEELTEEVAERTQNAPKALIELITLSYDERKALSPDVPDLAASYEVENRDSELGADLRSAVVTALALTGQYHEAFSELQSLERHDGEAARTAVTVPLMTLLTERADDVTFLQYALVFAANSTSDEVAPLGDLVADRLLQLGFAQQAQALLQKMPMEPENTGRRLALARAALAMETPQAALVELMGLSGSEANRLRAEALWLNGEFARAGEFLLDEDTDAATRGFWHAEGGDIPEGIDPATAERFGQVADVTDQIRETAKEPTGLPPLAHARALVESSEGTRGGIADLLNRVTTDATASDDGS
ncbi:hypothetical protein [Phaeobacter sp.]|uniref:hypothetical protein n=1 Tax=Phaeobacter sp. TaxID=1902409 RepID=UPI0025DBF777|nr:hypothetical protein [Phaeobacter sp.]